MWQAVSCAVVPLTVPFTTWPPTPLSARKQTARAAATGAWFSVNASMARSTALPEIPHDRLLLETDAPYSRAKEPGQLSGALAMISSTWKLPVDECAAIVQRNQTALLAVTPRTATAIKRIAPSAEPRLR